MSAGLPLEVSGLEVRAASGRVLVAVPHLAVAAGEAVALRGPSGAGKSTLLYALAGLVRAQAGAVRWDGQDLAAMAEARRAAFRRDNVGFVFQDHLLFEELSAAGNAALAAAYAPRGARARIREAAQAGLARMGLGAAGRRRAATLSGGERQRVAMARALAADPGIVLADEPTASLDRANADRLIADLVGLARAAGRTLIVVSHDAHMHAAADRVIDMADGRLAPLREVA